MAFGRILIPSGVSVDGTLNAVEASDAAAFAGTVTTAGVLAATEAPDTAAFSATVVWLATLAATEASDTAAFVGMGVSPTGTLAATEASDVAAFLGQGATATGTFAATEAPDTAAFVGAVFSNITGTFAAVEASDTASFSEPAALVRPLVPPPGAAGAAGNSSRTWARDRRQSTNERLSRKQMKMLIEGLPKADQDEILRNIDDEDIAFLLEHMDDVL